MKRFTKRLTEFKAQADGSVTAVIATLNVKDHDRDVTLPGFFGSQPAVIVGSHDWSDLMLGKGMVTEKGEQAIFEGAFNLDDPDAKAVHSKLMYDLDHPPALLEWSYGFEVHKGGASRGQHEGEDVQFLQPLADGSPGAKVWEVSPVIAGAGIGTGTLAAKNRPTTLSGQIAAALKDLGVIEDGVVDLAARLESQGHSLTTTKADLLISLGDGLTKTLAAVTAVLEKAEEADDDDETDDATDDAGVGDLELLQAQFGQYADA